MHDAGKDVPAIRDRPNPVGYEWLWQAFNDLNTCRTYGMGPGPIPWTAIEQYAQSHRMDVEDTWMLHRVIRHLDSVWLECHAKPASTAPRNPVKATGSQRGSSSR